MINGAIFDLDGTILDSMGIWDTVAEDYLRTLGKEPKENLKETFKTFTLEQSAMYYRQNYGVSLSVEEIVEGINRWIKDFYKEQVLLKKGVKAFLACLQKRGIKMCIATVTDKALAETALQRLGVRSCFSEIITCAEVGHGKEKPHIYRAAQAHLETEKEETAVFEDALHALQTAKQDGFITVGVLDSHEQEQEQLQKTADFYIADFEKAEEVLFGKRKMRTALTIAGSDSSGGAGIQADLKTMTANGVYGMSAITAMTAQNTMGVRAIEEASPAFLKQQLDAVFTDIFPDAVKIGMVSSEELIAVIAERLRFYKAKNIVVDPVMVATSGNPLIKNEAVEALTKMLFPLATLVTPNIPEAEVLSGLTIQNADDMETVAKSIGDAFGCAVLLKGGHLVCDANDLLYANGIFKWFYGKKIDNPNTHGTGCTVSSAIACGLAKGLSLEESVQSAKDYVSGALSAMLDLGQGAGPLNHAFNLTE